MLTQLISTLFALLTFTAAQQLCQRAHGLTLLRKPAPLVCTQGEALGSAVNIRLRTRNHRQESTPAVHVIRRVVTCDSYLNFFGTHMHQVTNSTLALTAKEAAAIKDGFCPHANTEHAPAEDERCRYVWLSSETTSWTFCEKQNQIIYFIPGQPIASPVAPYTGCSYLDGFCVTPEGGILHWLVDVDKGTNLWTTKYTGIAFLYDQIVLTVPALQGAITLSQKVVVEDEWSGWMGTVEGFEVQVRLSSTAMRNRRQTDQDLLLNVTRGDMLMKLQYLTNMWYPPIKTIEELCSHQKLRAQIPLPEIETETYYRRLFNNSLLSIVDTGTHLLVWPCKPVERWHIRPTEGICYRDIPIRYWDDGWREGFMDPRTLDIHDHSPESPCSASLWWYQLNTTLVISNGRSLYTLDVRTAIQLPAGRIHSPSLPIWKNTWVIEPNTITRANVLAMALADIQRQQNHLNQRVSQTISGGPSIAGVADWIGTWWLSLGAIGGAIYLLHITLSILFRFKQALGY